MITIPVKVVIAGLFQIRKSLTCRRHLRRSGRNRETCYRVPRFDNSKCSNGWLTPSLSSRIDNIETWVAKILLLANIFAISQELVRFNLQRMQNREARRTESSGRLTSPQISGVEYQQGTLAGYEVREDLLQKRRRKCAYCKEGSSSTRSREYSRVLTSGENVLLHIEHAELSPLTLLAVPKRVSGGRSANLDSFLTTIFSVQNIVGSNEGF